MFVKFDPLLPTPLYKQQMEQTTRAALDLENDLMNETEVEAIKLLFKDFVQVHREMINAEYAWFEALKRDMAPKPEPKKPFYKRYLKK